MDFNEDAYWENMREEYEGNNRKVVTMCDGCRCDMYEGEECYSVDGKYYCDDCVIPITLEPLEIE